MHPEAPQHATEAPGAHTGLSEPPGKVSRHGRRVDPARCRPPLSSRRALALYIESHTRPIPYYT